ncbi:DUF692 domain-containing protein [Legionella fairfieldensis]|uniref:MNIO family bufferin maturase n=1 Tax=Legionella fairfieldensis TaxID=45064 RepID=UPI00048FC5E8|nr:DUF692 domain-containing protein [Legionella fairfieldensis]
MHSQKNGFPYLGFGLGLRSEHYETILQQKPPVDWFEIISENYLIPGGKPLYYLDQIRAHYPLAMHGVSLSLGSTDSLDYNYLKQLKSLAERIEPVWISDHLCWTGINGLNMHDLLPLPYTEETITHVVSRINEIQDYLGRQILIENVSSYLTFLQSEMTEWEFISEIVKQADCYHLLDVNNIYVSAVNHDFHPLDYIEAIKPERVVQIHLAGHSNQGCYIIDTHDASIVPPVWDLYAKTIARFGPISTMIERDDHIPPLSELLIELNQARKIGEQSPAEGLVS